MDAERGAKLLPNIAEETATAGERRQNHDFRSEEERRNHEILLESVTQSQAKGTCPREGCGLGVDNLLQENC